MKKAMEAALWIHDGYPANKASLAGKQPGPQPFKTPIEIPELGQKYKAQLDWDGKVVGSCVHCHMIGSALQTWHRQQKMPMPEELIYPFPEPETIGLTMKSEEIAQVDSVAADSIAAKAGVKAGDELVSFAGQPLVSIADISYALHRTANEATVPCVVKRAGTETSLSLTLPNGWRRKSQVTERGTIWPERGMALGGMRVEPNESEGIGLKIKTVGKYGMHAAAQKAGFKEGDVLLAFDGITTKTGETELIGHLLQAHQAGEKVTVKLQRGDKTMELQLPMQ
jgi:predicted metalloprotease with PDZ domain